MEPVDWSSIHKEDSDGHFEDPSVAFFSFKYGSRPPTLPVHGLQAIPHIGMYTNDDYCPALPMMCVALPVSVWNVFPQSLKDLLVLAARRRLIDVHRTEENEEFGLEVWAILHSGYTPAQCSHFRCASDRHLNLQLHAWAFGDPDEAHRIQSGGVLRAEVMTGIFAPSPGVRPCHEALAYTAMPFSGLDNRQVLAHHGRFSPNNCNFAIAPDAEDVTFFSFTIDTDRPPSAGQKAVIALHCVPVGDARADQIRVTMRGKETLGELLPALETIIPDFAGRVLGMLNCGEQLPDTVLNPVADELCMKAAGAGKQEKDMAYKPTSRATQPGNGAGSSATGSKSYVDNGKDEEELAAHLAALRVNPGEEAVKEANEGNEPAGTATTGPASQLEPLVP